MGRVFITSWRMLWYSLLALGRWWSSSSHRRWSWVSVGISAVWRSGTLSWCRLLPLEPGKTSAPPPPLSPNGTNNYTNQQHASFRTHIYSWFEKFWNINGDICVSNDVTNNICIKQASNKTFPHFILIKMEYYYSAMFSPIKCNKLKM